jgi:murein DD-endopeptidase MepM/ murein hydrolase activator NlpD
MGENRIAPPLRVAAMLSLALLVGSCGARRDAAPVVMNGPGAPAPDRIETAPVPPMAPIPQSTRPRPNPAPPSGPGQRIVVRPGQSVGYLAQQYGVSKHAIIEANHLTPPEYKIEIGQTLVIPGAGPGGGPGPIAERGPAQEAAKPPPPERATVAARPGRAGEVIPLDEPPAPRKSAEASRPPAAPARGKLSPPAAAGEEEAEAEPPAKGGGRLPWPVRGRVVAGYGATKEGGHNAGINIAAARGAPVRAVDSGVVAYAGNEIRGYGNLVLVKHPNGLISAYAHLDSLLVKRGDTVKGGQVIAKVGDTGGVPEPQLHFELRRGKEAVDPREYLGPGANAGGARGSEG